MQCDLYFFIIAIIADSHGAVVANDGMLTPNFDYIEIIRNDKERVGTYTLFIIYRFHL